MTFSNSRNGHSLHLAYFSPESFGGLADYAREQAQALSAAGARVSFITSPSVAKVQQNAQYKLVPILAEVPSRSESRNRWSRRLRSMSWIVGNMRRLAEWVEREQVKCVLLGAYMEYFAPLWAPQFLRLAQKGVVFGSVVHDPLRNFIVGPLWWHRWSTACGYSFLREAFIHEPIDLPTVRPQPQLCTTVIPHGPFRFPAATESRSAVRQRLRIPEPAQLLLAFGHIRDVKNLDLLLEAMVQRPEFYLLVAGREQGASQRPAAFYQQRAAALGIADRCRWETRHIPELEVGNYFEASDLMALTYGTGFRSASGVLNAAVHFRKPCLASSGLSNLRTMIEKYALGFWVEPDSALAIADGLQRWLRERPAADWKRYAEDNSWKRNAELVLGRFSPEWQS